MLYETGFGRGPAWVGPAAPSGAEPARKVSGPDG